jgi:hypothetical protein
VTVPAYLGVDDDGVWLLPVDCAVTLKWISVFFVLDVGNRSVPLLA